MISILIPTRGSPDGFAIFIDSLKHFCSSLKKVEVIAKVDDDTNDYKYVDIALKKSGFKYSIFSSPRGRGYLDIPKFYSDLVKVASGSILWQLGDDLTIVRGDWVQQLMSTRNVVSGNVYLAYCYYARSLEKLERGWGFRGRFNAIPIVSREFYDKLKILETGEVQLDEFIGGIAKEMP